jgi:hypothetical protein
MCRYVTPAVGVTLLLLPWRVGLKKLDDTGLAWYNGMGLTKADEGALRSYDDEQRLSTPADAPYDGLHPCHRNTMQVCSAPTRSTLAAKDPGKRSAKKPTKHSLTLR